MDKNLNSSKSLPWWLVVIQMSPLILQLVGEIILRVQGTDGLMAISPSLSEKEIPPPLDVKLE
jgi:hypothetical protein